MIVSDLRNHPAVVEFISTLKLQASGDVSERPIVLFILSSQGSHISQGGGQQGDFPPTLRGLPYIFTYLPAPQSDPPPMLAHSSRRYAMNPKQWSELSYEVTQGKLRMGTYLSNSSHLGSSGRVVINIFGGLNPIVAALMSNLNIFSYIISSFIYTLSEKIEHIRPLQIVNFEEDDDEAEDK